MTHNILDLLPRLPAVTYTIKISQRHDGSMSIYVNDVTESDENRIRIASALRRAADAIENPEDRSTP